MLLAGCVTASAATIAPVRVVEISAGCLELDDAGVMPLALEQLHDAGAVDVEQVGAGLVLTPDAGWLAVGAGCYETSASCMGLGQTAASWQAEKAELERVPPGVRPQLVSAGVGLVLGVAIGIITTYEICTASGFCSRP